jgi:hypothetical protein
MPRNPHRTRVGRAHNSTDLLFRSSIGAKLPLQSNLRFDGNVPRLELPDRHGKIGFGSKSEEALKAANLPGRDEASVSSDN